ncbi:poly-beta-1,6-N-acetyl-D-glucosamine biosynthesis protein PgaD [Pseudomonas kribbensis]|uniref:Poly-beta-1,6-N-acetyl-D-glucosamine biosynthesis protein PgaD n=1 Tax=Pseudomonas kribbensis TaxID=1628086 RepID=A0A345RIH4_9PSED|nr:MULTISPECIES: poly-beta-1,6-N-acetyl-D-glucosamine biosynthesis protein PgaD [Pseudomonas]AXI59090.1 poly-beta-1,6-N-acetyl-D-glucosamine biosynthesis protein PgaD [Pseudomonas kribbensis]MCX2543221.1 poly-beta-1,6-N-acetyl-D-glucosamine biosynthesis protein PgaD [Pseudomonas sp. COW5]TFH83487.1 poly-beta-1,6-N-acetyl-D-glucosamine biosynthesis protein PgaD [Pseudomonas kribbensis]
MKIIRTRQRPFLVVIDVILTVLAWVGLLYLLVRGLWPLIETHAGGPRIDNSAFEALGTLQIYMWVALVNAVILISWARYQQRKSRSFAQRRLAAPVVDDDGLSKSFKLCDDRLQKLRSPGVITIHNNQDGDVSHVVPHLWPVEPAELPPPLAPLEHPRVIFLHAEDDDNREPTNRL